MGDKPGNGTHRQRAAGPTAGPYNVWSHVRTLKHTRRTVITAASAAALAIGGGAAGLAYASHRTVTIEVDGAAQRVSGFFSTVGDAISAGGITTGDHDLIAPAPESSVSSGDTVVVRTATEYRVSVDGAPTTAWSTASSVSGVLDAVPSAGSVAIAADRSQSRAEMPVGADTVHVAADGTTTDVTATAADGASAILEKAGVSAGPLDRVAFHRGADGVTLRVQRVTRGNVTSSTSIDYATEERDDDTLDKGTTKTVQEGAAGSETTVAYQESVDGVVTVSAVLSTTRTEPTTRIVANGTKEAAQPAPAASAAPSSGSSGSSAPSDSGASAPSGDDASIWAAIAQCESGGNPTTNTGNGYYGMYQFSLPTWRSVGGAGLPSEASAEEQTMRARMLQQRAGWGQWGCAYKLGLV